MARKWKIEGSTQARYTSQERQSESTCPLSQEINLSHCLRVCSWRDYKSGCVVFSRCPRAGVQLATNEFAAVSFWQYGRLPVLTADAGGSNEGGSLSGPLGGIRSPGAEAEKLYWWHLRLDW